MSSAVLSSHVGPTQYLVQQDNDPRIRRNTQLHPEQSYPDNLSSKALTRCPETRPNPNNRSRLMADAADVIAGGRALALVGVRRVCVFVEQVGRAEGGRV